MTNKTTERRMEEIKAMVSATADTLFINPHLASTFCSEKSHKFKREGLVSILRNAGASEEMAVMISLFTAIGESTVYAKIASLHDANKPQTK